MDGSLLTCLALVFAENLFVWSMLSVVHVVFPSICHNDVRDLTAGVWSEVCCDVGYKPVLQPLQCEPLHFATANREDSALLDVVARDFWSQCSSILNHRHHFAEPSISKSF